jgi:NifU-like protein involved in Fe-S cluster formation
VSAPLYTIEMLRLAAAVADFPPLATPDARAERRSKTCGSRVAVTLSFDEAGAVAACGLEVHACALGQAAAALLARGVAGEDAAAIGRARDTLAAYLAGEADTPGDWPGIGALATARDYPARHPSIRLAFEAAADAAAHAMARAAA